MLLWGNQNCVFWASQLGGCERAESCLYLKKAGEGLCKKGECVAVRSVCLHLKSNTHGHVKQFFKLEFSGKDLSEMSWVRFEQYQWKIAKQTPNGKAFSYISRHLISLFLFFTPIKLSKVQVTILHYSGSLSHCSSTLSYPNWTSADNNCISLRSVKVTARRGIMVLGIEHSIWSQDSACCCLLSCLYPEDNGGISLPAVLNMTMNTN